jgi:serine/threonine-protein kinase
MAELFLAHRVHDAHEVVLKRLLPELEDREDVLDLFLTEADVGRLLRHDNIVPVIDAGDHHGRYFIVMERVDGIVVDELLEDAVERNKPVDAGLACRIAVDALRGLHAAHTLTSPQGTHFGLVHRDVSPDNLYVTSSGVTKVGDFGVARLSNLEGHSQGGLIKGKLAYMAPEQVRRGALDGRADGFALALVLYELLTGVQPFGAHLGEDEVHNIVRVQRGHVRSLLATDPSLPKPVARVVDKALRRMRFLRFPHCAAFADALEHAAVEAGVWASRTTAAQVVAEVRARRAVSAHASDLQP